MNSSSYFIITVMILDLMKSFVDAVPMQLLSYEEYTPDRFRTLIAALKIYDEGYKRIKDNEEKYRPDSPKSLFPRYDYPEMAEWNENAIFNIISVAHRAEECERFEELMAILLVKHMVSVYIINFLARNGAASSDYNEQEGWKLLLDTFAVFQLSDNNEEVIIFKRFIEAYKNKLGIETDHLVNNMNILTASFKKLRNVPLADNREAEIKTVTEKYWPGPYEATVNFELEARNNLSAYLRFMFYGLNEPMKNIDNNELLKYPIDGCKISSTIILKEDDRRRRNSELVKTCATEFTSVLAKIICSYELEIAMQILNDDELVDFKKYGIELEFHSPLSSMSVYKYKTGSVQKDIIYQSKTNLPDLKHVPYGPDGNSQGGSNANNASG